MFAVAANVAVAFVMGKVRSLKEGLDTRGTSFFFFQSSGVNIDVFFVAHVVVGIWFDERQYRVVAAGIL